MVDSLYNNQKISAMLRNLQGQVSKLMEPVQTIWIANQELQTREK